MSFTVNLFWLVAQLWVSYNGQRKTSYFTLIFGPFLLSALLLLALLLLSHAGRGPIVLNLSYMIFALLGITGGFN